MTDPFPAPIEAVVDDTGSTRWTLHLPADQREVVSHLIGELRALLRDGDPDRPPLIRLFPPVYVDDEEKEAEYRRLMRDDLITSRLAQLDAADALLGPDGPESFAEGDTLALMQSINAVRVVLGTILDVTDDHEFADDLDDDPDDRLDDGLDGDVDGRPDGDLRDDALADDLDDPDHGHEGDDRESTAAQLYDYLSWLLEWVVRSHRH